MKCVIKRRVCVKRQLSITLLLRAITRKGHNDRNVSKFHVDVLIYKTTHMADEARKYDGVGLRQRVVVFEDFLWSIFLTVHLITKTNTAMC
jgi:hypothetical protein